MTSNALVHVGKGTPQYQGGTVIRRGVGLTMAQLIHKGGQVTTRVLNIGFDGPLKPKEHIQEFFSDAKRRERVLDELYQADRDDLTKEHKKLLKHCQDLLKYALPECTVTTQLITFKILVEVTTRYPGIRHLFHHPKGSKKGTPPAASDFKTIWNRPHQECGEEWNFYRDFADHCLSDSPLTKLVESKLPSKFGQLKLLGDNLNKDPVESLLSFCGPDCLFDPADPAKLCATRYLASILELPKFWRLKTEEGIDIGQRFFGFLSLLCETILHLIRDTGSRGDSEEHSSPLWTSARSAVDILVLATFGGFLLLHRLGEKLPICPSQLPIIVSLLTQPEMERSFPKASHCAPNVKGILDWGRAPSQPSRLFALIIGINTYTSTSLPNLSGAVNDGMAVWNFLRKDMYIPSRRIRSIFDRQASRSTIIDAFRQLSEEPEINKGDPILIYYAGHGAQLPLPDGWEPIAQGQLEAICPYDYAQGVTHAIPDRTVAALIDRIAEKKGNNITVILDCCFSASGTRESLVRGTNTRGVLLHDELPLDLDRELWAPLGRESRRGLRSHVVISACSPMEIAQEEAGRGRFTAALLDLFKGRMETLTYSDIATHIEPITNQHPAVEGINLDRIIFT